MPNACVRLGTSTGEFADTLNSLALEGELIPIPDYSPEELAENLDLLKHLEGAVVSGPFREQRGGTVVVSFAVADGRIYDLRLSRAAQREREVKTLKEDAIVVVKDLTDRGYFSYVKGTVRETSVYSLTAITGKALNRYNSWAIHFPNDRTADGSDTFVVRFDNETLVQLRGF